MAGPHEHVQRLTDGNGQAPEVEAKIVAELDEMGLLASHEHPTPRALEWEDLSKLGYLSCVIKAGCPA